MNSRPIQLLRGMVCALAIALPLLASSPAKAALKVDEFPTPSASSQPLGITIGPDGRLWFAEGQYDHIGSLDTSKVPVFGTDLPLAAGSFPEQITTGPDKNLWFTELQSDKVARMTTSGSVSEFSVPTPGSQPLGITAGPDGNVWFTEEIGDKIGRITSGGVIKEFPLPAPGRLPFGITAGADGNLWFTESSTGLVGRITPSGVVTEFPVAANSSPLGITAGPDGNVWFTEEDGNRIGRITPSGAVTEFPVPVSGRPLSIAPGPCGNLWFTYDSPTDGIGEITTGGTITMYPVPSPTAYRPWLTSGPDGNVWYTEYTTSARDIARINLSTSPIFHCGIEIPSGFVFATLSDQQGGTVGWMSLSPGLHGVMDTSGMGLFDTPNGLPIGETYTFAFRWAGVYSYADPFHAAFKGKVKVPVGVQLVPGTTDQARVTWASGDAPGGFGFDVQVRPPGAPAYVDWRTGTTSLNGVFGPSDPLWAGPGVYSFHARLRQLSSGAASGYSAGRPISLG